MKDSTRTKRHLVYRCYDAADRLVYVGMTSLPMRQRMSMHRIKNAAVTERTTRIDTTVYADRASAAEAESRAIDAESPLLNVRRGAAYEADWDDLAAAVMSLPSVSGSGAR